jgi:single-strand DNA-binding protein
MNHLNTVLIEGNLTRDPKGIGENSANPGCRFIIANNRYRMKNGMWEKETTFFPVLVFGRIGEACARTLKRGRGVRVCGRLKQDLTKNSLTDTTYILAEHVEFQPERPAPNDGSTGQGNFAQGGQAQGNGQAQSGYTQGGAQAGYAQANYAQGGQVNYAQAGGQAPGGQMTSGGQAQTQYQSNTQSNYPQGGPQGAPNNIAVQAPPQGNTPIQFNTTPPASEPAYGQGYKQDDGCVGNLLTNGPTATSVEGTEDNRGPEAFEEQSAQGWDSSVPDNVPAAAEAKLEGIGNQVSAEEISDIDKSEADFDEANNSADQFTQSEPDF